MTTVRLTHPADLRLLPDGTTLTIPGIAEPILWLHAYARPHQDPDTELWRLPLNPFVEYGVTEIDAALPEVRDEDRAPIGLRGDEPWLTTLTDPHDTTR